MSPNTYAQFYVNMEINSVILKENNVHEYM